VKRDSPVAEPEAPAALVDYRSHDQRGDDDSRNEETEPPMNLLMGPVSPLLAFQPLVHLVPHQQPLETCSEKQESRTQIGALVGADVEVSWEHQETERNHRKHRRQVDQNEEL